MKYRREIDGLRALAVIPVILFHAGFETFSGGFIGVDVFFVISGYLITRIILFELDAGQFSILSFYERRARRILPALLFVMFACLPFAWILLLPSEMKDFSQSIVAVTIFASNILFSAETGYFDTAAELKPLLHTWSLAVEEQYYLIFPALLLLMSRLGKRSTLAVLIAIFVISLTMAQFGSVKNPDTTFYLLSTRGWELLLGVFVAFYHRADYVSRISKLNELGGMVGLACIFYATFRFNERIPSPSLVTLVPTFGTVLIILFANQNTLLGRILAHNLLVGVGLISYSAYLWHQPIFAFLKNYPLIDYTPGIATLGIFVTFGLAIVSWRCIEIPVRKKIVFRNRKILSLVLGAGLAFFLCIGSFGHLTQGFYSRFDRYEIILSVTKSWRDDSSCTLNYEEIVDFERTTEAVIKRCFINGKTVMLMGDSHAESISKPLRMRLERLGYQLISFIYDGCLPIQGTARSIYESHCIEFNRVVWEHIQPLDASLVLSSRWRLNLVGERYDNGEGGIEYGKSGLTYVVNDPRQDIRNYTLTKLSEMAQKKNLYIINQIPEAGWHVPKRMIWMRTFCKTPRQLSTSYTVYRQQNATINYMFEKLEQLHNIRVIETEKLVCSSLTGRCLNELDGIPLYRDDDHPSELFSTLIIDRLIHLILVEGARARPT